MSGSFRGDFTKLRKFIAQLHELSGPGPVSQISRAMGDEAMKLVEQGFRTQKDPYGQKWSPHSPATKRRSRSRILTRSGRLRSGFVLRSSASGFSISNATPYASVHQTGADYVAKGRVMFHDQKGRFRGASSKSKSGLILGRFKAHGSHRIRIPARLMVPTSDQNLGRLWDTRLRRVARNELTRIFRGR